MNNNNSLISDLGLNVKVIEPRRNTEAREYINNNYNTLIKYIKSLGVIEKASDLLADVAISIIEAENDGEGFDNICIGDANYKPISVQQFVLGRIKGYSKNSKYSSKKIEEHTTYVVRKETKVTEKVDSKGNIKREIKTKKEKVSSLCTAYAASFNESDDINANNDSFQKAYYMAASYDSLQDVEDSESIRNCLDTCIDICEIRGIKILNLLKNLDKISEMLDKYKSSNIGVFEKISQAVSYNDDLAEALETVIHFSQTNGDEFKLILADY